MIRLAQPFIAESAISKAVEVIRSGMLVQGRCVGQFEEQLSGYLNTSHAILVSSGTAALHLSLISAGISAGDEVIVPAFTFPATANAVVLCGAKPVLVDISLDDCCIDVSKIEKAITPATRAIIPVHEFGQAADMAAIMNIAQKHKLLVIEDAACALGTEFKNKKLGTFGTTGCFSFHPRKAITTGEGGLVITDDDALAARIRALRNHGITAENGTSVFKYAGLNYRMTEFQAALGLGQMPELETMIEQRIRIAELYQSSLSELSWISIPEEIAERRMVYQTFHVMTGNDINRNELIAWLKQNGIETNYGAQALNAQPFFQNAYGYKDEDFPVALASYEHGLALPIGPHIGPAEVKYICETLKKYPK